MESDAVEIENLMRINSELSFTPHSMVQTVADFSDLLSTQYSRSTWSRWRVGHYLDR
jgi:hypothetical protein